MTLVSYVIGTGKEPFKSTCATADFASVMAIAARVYRPFDADYSEKCLKSAKRAWTWLGALPEPKDAHPLSTCTTGDRVVGSKHRGPRRACLSGPPVPEGR